MQYYFPEKISLKKSYRNPFRKDDSPGCRFYYTTRGILMFRDPSHSSYTGDCFKICSLLNNFLSFPEVLDLIKKDFNIFQKPKSFEEVKKKRKKIKKVVIQKHKKPFKIFPNSYDFYPAPHLSYWKEFGVSREILDIYGVKPLHDARFGREKIYHRYFNNGLSFFYTHDDGYTIYSPFAQKNKRFLKSTKSEDIQADEGLQYFDELDYLIVTKSLKDTMVLFSLGIPSVSLHSEMPKVPSYIERKINYISDNVYILYDNDDTGVRHSKLLSESTGWKNIILSNYNDSAEYAKNGDSELLVKEIMSQINE